MPYDELKNQHHESILDYYQTEKALMIRFEDSLEYSGIKEDLNLSKIDDDLCTIHYVERKVEYIFIGFCLAIEQSESNRKMQQDKGD